jgi:hypothetical protein
MTIRQKYSNLFYDPDLDLHQGGYLTEAPSELVGLLVHRFRETDQLRRIPLAPPYVVESGGFNAADMYHGGASEGG